MYFISNIFLRIRGGSKSLCTNAIFFALVQELIDRPSYINEQLLEHDAYISCLQLKKVNVAHGAMHNNYLYNHTAYYHVLQQVIAFLVIILIILNILQYLYVHITIPSILRLHTQYCTSPTTPNLATNWNPLPPNFFFSFSQ